MEWMSLQRARGAFLKIAARFMGCTRSTFRIRLLSDIKVYLCTISKTSLYVWFNKQTNCLIFADHNSWKKTVLMP